MWKAATDLLGTVPGDDAALAEARSLATLPMRLGGLGLRSAERVAPAAYWASWADALAMIKDRAPTVATAAVASLSGAAAADDAQGCLAEARAAADLLSQEGFLQLPSWAALQDGLRPKEHCGAEPGEWARGWQYVASSTRETHFPRSAVLSRSSPTDCAHLRSHSGLNAGIALSGAPTAPEFEIEPFAFRVLLLERLRLPLPLAEATCEGCRRELDPRGSHRGACMSSGRVKRRAAPVEGALARVCREAGATVKWNAKLANMNLGVAAGDQRRIEVLAQGLPLRAGAQLAVDITLRSALTADGAPKPRAATVDGAAAASARQDKEAAYPELLAARRCDLVVVAIETGGRWSTEAADFVEQLAYARARDAPARLRLATALAWKRRWARLLGTACANAFANSLVALAGDITAPTCDGAAPALSDLLGPGDGSHEAGSAGRG